LDDMLRHVEQELLKERTFVLGGKGLWEKVIAATFCARHTDLED
jgi:hypothetical protein